MTACATGTNTIGEAFRAIQYGEADIMVSGGTEGSICPTAIAGFTSLTALTAETDPERCSIPFDKERSGFVMGEGAAVVVLEELEHANVVAQRYMQRLSVMAVLRMRIISHLRQKMAAAQQELC